MRKFSRKALALSLCVVLGATGFTGCGDKKNGGGSSKGDNTADMSTGLNKDAEGDISIMVWSGDGQYYEDIGHMDWTKDDIKAQNVAAVYAVAKKFNETYPNVKINLFAKSGDPNQAGTNTWDQEIENFKVDHGKYPDIWASTDVPNDIKKGLVADLSVYKDESSYKAYNESLMATMNYWGFQGALPSYSIPWGIWVNKSLATENNIDVPDIDWDIDEYTDFIKSADCETFWGDKSTPVRLIETGTEDINKSILDNGTVNVNSDAVKDLLTYVPEWAETTVDVAEGAGNLSEEIAKECGQYSWYYFCNNRLLTDSNDPWYLASAADPNAKSTLGVVQADDFDIYPRPSTEYCDNTVGTVVDPICVHNYALDDKNAEWSDSEKQQLLVAYTFATYWTGSTEAKQAIADQEWVQGTSYKPAMNDTFPVVTGDAYDEQMDIWYSIDSHAVYKDTEKFPGFAEVVRLYKEGQTWDYSDKTTPVSITENGEKQSCLYEWENMWDENVAGAWQTDPDWVDNVKSRLADWNTAMNKDLEAATEQLKESLKEYYGFTDADFK